MPSRCPSIAQEVIPRPSPMSSAVTMSFFTNLADVRRLALLSRLPLPHLRIQPHQLREDLENHLRRREMRLPPNPRKVIEPDLLNGKTPILRLHNQLRIDQRPLRLQIDGFHPFALE